MSRLAKKPVALPAKVEVTISTNVVEAKGPRGTMSSPIPEHITVRREEGNLFVDRNNDSPTARANQGLAYSLLRNAVIGVTEGFKKELDIVGIGYKAVLAGKTVTFSLGYSHDINYPIPEGIQIEVPQQNKVIVTGNDKQQVGQVAAELRALRKPEVYKGKGVKYTNEIIRKKAGKSKM